MQDVLFRGKRKDNGELVEGYYIKYGYAGNEKDYIVPTYASALYAFEVIPETVGQWTGRKIDDDKLFEGDIIGRYVDYDEFDYSEIAYQKDIIVWDDECCCFGLKDSEGEIREFDIDDSCEIIGSIHDKKGEF